MRAWQRFGLNQRGWLQLAQSRFRDTQLQCDSGGKCQSTVEGPGAGEAGVRDAPLNCVWCPGVRILISRLVGGRPAYRGDRGPSHPYIHFDSSCPSAESGAELGRQNKAQRREGKAWQTLRRVGATGYVTPAQQQASPGNRVNSGQLEVRVSLCPLAHTATLATHLLPCVSISLPTKQGRLQTSQESREILSSSEHLPRTEGARGGLTTHKASCRLNGDERPLTL